MRIPGDLIQRLGETPDTTSEPVPSLDERTANERFRLVESVGAGGMGEVFRARDHETGRTVAVKLLATLDEEDDAFLRFEREAATLAGLDHPAIVGYVAHGRMNGRAFIAMRWLEGENLAARFERQPLTVAETISLGARIAAALAAAHDRGIVHRDVKPTNVFLPEGDAARAMLIDFGIARLSWAPTSLTRVGTAIGTPGFMAPEQARGSSWLDARADVFGLGCVLYRCLTGRLPFRGQDAIALLTKTLFSDPPTPRALVAEIPPALDELVMRMLEKQAQERPDDAQDVLDALEALGPVDDRTPAPRSTAYLALTQAEQRLSSVLLIGTSSRGPASGHPSWSNWVAAARNHAVELSPLADGTVVASLSSGAGALEAVMRVARAALVLRALVPGVPMMLATGRGLFRRGAAASEVVDRAAEGLARLTAARDPRAGSAVCIDRVSAALLAPHFEVTEIEDHHWLTGEAGGDAVIPVEGRVTPFVGRRRLLNGLESAWREVATKRVARAVVVAGPPGIGKSRLWRELLLRLRKSPQRPNIWVGRADATRAGSPYALMADAIRGALRVAAGEPREVTRRKIENRLSQRLPPEKRSRVSAELAALLGVSEGTDPRDLAHRDPSLHSELVLDALSTLLESEAERGPICLVLEDLQWGDRPSAAFAAHAARTLADRGLLLLGIARPEIATTFPELWAELSPVAIELPPLSPKNARRLVAAALPDAASRELDELVAAGDGNPYALEELVRSRSEGMGRERPESVLALAASRIDELSDNTRLVLRAASVFGSTFWPSALEELAPEADIDAAIEDLLRREIVARAPLSRFPKEPELVFLQSLVRDAAHASLTPSDRELGHRLAAAWLERARANDPLALAEHHRLGGEPGRAVPHFHRAARDALRVSDFSAAIGLADRALECANAEIERGGARFPEELLGSIHLTRAEARRWSGDARGALAAAKLASAKLAPGSDSWLAAMSELVAAAGRLGDYDRVEAGLGEILAARVAGTDRSAQVVALCPGASQLFQAGRRAKGEELFRAIDALSRRSPLDLVARARLEQLRGFVTMHRGEPWLAKDCYALARDAFLQLGSSRNVAIERVNRANALIELGQLEEAADELEQALFVSQLLDLTTVRAFALMNLGRIHTAALELDEAERVEAEALRLGMAEKNPRITGAARVHLARVALARGDAVVAEAEARTAIELLSVAPPLRAGAFATLAEALLAQGRAREALEPAEAALELVRTGQNESFDALTRAVHVAVCLANGRDARSACEDAAEAIRARAARIGDPELRRSFLQRVEAHARILDMAGRLGATLRG